MDTVRQLVAPIWHLKIVGRSPISTLALWLFFAFDENELALVSLTAMPPVPIDGDE